MKIIRGGESLSNPASRATRGLGAHGAAQLIADTLMGLRGLRRQDKCVTVFGSARAKPDSDLYAIARDLGQLLALEGFTVMSGGGPGVMEAVSLGAKQANGHTIGCNIELHPKQQPNPYLDLLLTFRHFSTRKSFLVHHACTVIVLPGGYGTLDELFEAAVLIQKQRIAPCPLVLLGRSFWTPIIDPLQQSLLVEGMIGASDPDVFHLVNTAAEAV